MRLRWGQEEGGLQRGKAGGVGLGLAPGDRLEVGVGEGEGVREGVGPGVGPTANTRQAPGQAPSHTYATPVALSVAKQLGVLRATATAGFPSPENELLPAVLNTVEITLDVKFTLRKRPLSTAKSKDRFLHRVMAPVLDIRARWASPPSPVKPAVFAADPATSMLLPSVKRAITRWAAHTYSVPESASKASPPRPRGPRHTDRRCAPGTVELQVGAPVPA